MSVSDPFAVQPRIEPEASHWLAHWHRKKTIEKICLVGMALLASWFTVQWYGNMGSPVTWVQVALTWWSTGYYWSHGPKGPEPMIELELNGPHLDPAEHSKLEFK